MQPFLGSVSGYDQLLNKANGRPVKSKKIDFTVMEKFVLD